MDAALGAGRFVEDVQLSRRDDGATVLIELGCPMRLQSDFVSEAGLLLEIRLLPLEDCRAMGLGSGIASERYRPPAGQLAHLTQVEYESLGMGDNILALRFDRPVSYRVTQRGNLSSIGVIVDLADDVSVREPLPDPSTLVSATKVPEPDVPQALPPPPATDRAPLTARVRELEEVANFVLNLQSTREPASPELLQALAGVAGSTLYVSQIDLDDKTWHRLRLGFFASEAEAREVLVQLGDSFPRAWVGRVAAEEMGWAAENSIQSDAASGGSAGSSVAATVAATATPAATPGALSGTTDPSPLPDRVRELMTEAREAMLDQDYDRAIRTYTSALQASGPHRAEAREYLGLARQKNGQAAHARAEYTAFLEEFPDGDGAQRVSQRLTGLVMAAEPPRERLRSAQNLDQPGSWDFFSGVSQYYRQYANQFNEDGDHITTQSALLSDMDFSARRTGSRFDMFGRVSASHFYDFLGESESSGDQSRLSYAYFDLRDVQEDWSVRLGRQSRHTGGVLGRFDGAHATYGWAEDREVSFTTGHPVDSSRDGVDTSRQFYGVAADFYNVLDAWDFTAFFNQQDNNGFEDRQAVGTEVRFMDETKSLVGLVDYDIGYGELNTVLLLGTWRFENRLTFNALIDQRRGSVLTTRNALIGQPVENLGELMPAFTEDEIRQLALDRTAVTRSVTLGVSRPLAQRFQVNADVTLTETDATVASGGVAAIPATGAQTFLSVSFVGSSLFKSGDVAILTLRSGDSETMKTQLLALDFRFPVSQKIRLNPRLRIAYRDSLASDTDRSSISPSFRLLVYDRRYRVEVEAGYDWLSRDFTGRTEETSAYFFNLGYRADF